MKIDFKKLQKMEKEMSCSPVSNAALAAMVQNVIAYNESKFTNAPNNIELSIRTLREMGILVMEEGDLIPGEIKQLNS